MHLPAASGIAIHASVVAAHGGAIGLRDPTLLKPAMSSPQATYGGEPLIKDQIEIAAAYLFYLCSNHPFVDGNKRSPRASFFSRRTA
jgi:death-on-curing protein